MSKKHSDVSRHKKGNKIIRITTGADVEEVEISLAAQETASSDTFDPPSSPIAGPSGLQGNSSSSGDVPSDPKVKARKVQSDYQLSAEPMSETSSGSKSDDLARASTSKMQLGSSGGSLDALKMIDFTQYLGAQCNTLMRVGGAGASESAEEKQSPEKLPLDKDAPLNLSSRRSSKSSGKPKKVNAKVLLIRVKLKARMQINRLHGRIKYFKRKLIAYRKLICKLRKRIKEQKCVKCKPKPAGQQPPVQA